MKKIIITTLALGLTAPYAFAAQADSDIKPETSPHGDRSHHPQLTEDRERPETTRTDRNLDREGTAPQAERSTRAQSWESERERTSTSAQTQTQSSREHSEKLADVRLVSRDEMRDNDASKQLLDAELVDTSGQKIGDIENVAVDAEGRVTDAYVQLSDNAGNFEGETVRVPYRLLTRSESNGEVSYRYQGGATQFLDVIENGDTFRDGEAHATLVDMDRTEGDKLLKQSKDIEVLDRNGRTLGSIDQFAFEDESVSGVYLDAEELAGSGDELVYLPFAALERDDGQGEVTYRLDVDRAELEQRLRGSDRTIASQNETADRSWSADTDRGEDTAEVRAGQQSGSDQQYARAARDQQDDADRPQTHGASERGPNLAYEDSGGRADWGSDRPDSGTETVAGQGGAEHSSQMDRPQDRRATSSENRQETGAAVATGQSGQQDSSERAWSQQQSRESSEVLNDVRVVSRDEISQQDTVDRVIDARVVDSDNETLGTITDLTLRDGSIENVFVRTGGVLGFGSQTVRLPFDALETTQRDDQETVYQLDVQRDEFSRALDNREQPTRFESGAEAAVVSDQERDQSDTLQRALGAEVVDSSGQSIGEVSDLVLRDNAIQGAYLSLNDRANLDGDLVYVPFDALEGFQKDGERAFRLTLSSDALNRSVEDDRSVAARS